MVQVPFDGIEFLPDDDHGELPQGAAADSEDARIAAMMRAAIKEHLRAALTPDDALRGHGGIDEIDRAESRRVLTSLLPGYAATREMLTCGAGFDPDDLRERVLRKLAEIGEAERENVPAMAAE